MPYGKKRRRAAAEPQRQPALRHARGKNHADEDEEIHQRAARVAGYNDDQPHHKGGMRRRLNDVFKAHKVSPILQQRKLIGEQNDEKDLYDLRRLHRDGEIAQEANAEVFADVIHTEPRAVAISRLAEGREQQQEKADVEAQQPLPLLRQLEYVDAREEEVERQPDEQAEALHGNVLERAAKACRAGDEHHAIERRGHAQREQHRVGLAQHVMQRFPHSSHRFFPSSAENSRNDVSV